LQYAAHFVSHFLDAGLRGLRNNLRVTLELYLVLKPVLAVVAVRGYPSFSINLFKHMVP